MGWLFDSVREALEVVVLYGGEVVQRLLDHRDDPVDTHVLGEVQHEPVAEHVHRVGGPGGEARHLVRVGHHLDQQHDAVHVLPRLEQPADDERLEVVEVVRVLAPNHVDVLLGELEGRRLEADVAGGVGEAEAVVDVDDVALAVQQNVPVVPVADLQEVRDDGVGGVALDEVLAGLEEVVGVDALEGLGDGLHVELALDHVDGAGVVQELDDAAVGPRHENLDGLQPERQLGLREDVAEEGEQLVDHVLLPEVVAALDDDGADVPRLQTAVGAVLPEALLFVDDQLGEGERLRLAWGHLLQQGVLGLHGGLGGAQSRAGIAAAVVDGGGGRVVSAPPGVGGAALELLPALVVAFQDIGGQHPHGVPDALEGVADAGNVGDVEEAGRDEVLDDGLVDVKVPEGGAGQGVGVLAARNLAHVLVQVCDFEVEDEGRALLGEEDLDFVLDDAQKLEGDVGALVPAHLAHGEGEPPVGEALLVGRDGAALEEHPLVHGLGEELEHGGASVALRHGREHLGDVHAELHEVAEHVEIVEAPLFHHQPLQLVLHLVGAVDERVGFELEGVPDPGEGGRELDLGVGAHQEHVGVVELAGHLRGLEELHFGRDVEGVLVAGADGPDDGPAHKQPLGAHFQLPVLDGGQTVGDGGNELAVHDGHFGLLRHFLRQVAELRGLVRYDGLVEPGELQREGHGGGSLVQEEPVQRRLAVLGDGELAQLREVEHGLLVGALGVEQVDEVLVHAGLLLVVQVVHVHVGVEVVVLVELQEAARVDGEVGDVDGVLAGAQQHPVHAFPGGLFGAGA
ncbi:octaprenyl-diphosphate synthase, putative [Babesia caballi]|uniref:Octaprenyl-diphosphate synthase, putative n=1 Tax=Babesia caballi TaxID=5871 RepID=A0AAV4LRQ7_BABCB|nr:octaprenyl-diphosphate synthase, putative [Babesia caballi]